MTLHPASLLLAWLSLALALQWLALPFLLGLAAMLFPIVLMQARPRLLLLLRRARWLLLSVVVLFALATPGSALPGFAGTLGITREGGELALTHALRLTLLLAMLAMLLERLGIPPLIGGLYTLLAPLGANRRRSQMALRLLLVLEYVEQGRLERRTGAQKGWQYWLNPQAAPDGSAGTAATYPPIDLPIARLKTVDYLAMVLSLLGACGLYWWSIQPA